MRGDAAAFDEHPTEISKVLERLVDRLEEGWRCGSPPAIDALLASDASAEPARRKLMLRELVLTEIEYRISKGERACGEIYLQRYPELRDDAATLAALEELSAFKPPAFSLSEAWRQTVAVRCEQADKKTAADAPLPPEPYDCRLRQPSLPPRRLGKFELHELLGRGSFGDVYRAHDLALGRDVAIKVPRPAPQTATEEVERFLREARNAARLRHPSIVKVYEAGCIGQTFYLACELVVGGTLRSRLARGPLDYRQSAEIVAQLADALDHAHREGVIHRDVKPSNILFDADGRPQLADFGLAKCDGADPTLTLTGAALGTPAFMSPEQVKGQPVDARSDVYSLGVVLYEALTGQLPFLGRGRMLVQQLLEDDPRPPRRLDDQIPRDLESICLKAMHCEARRRYRTAADFAADLGRYLRGEPVLARPVNRLSRGHRWCRRRPALTSLAVALFVAVAGGFFGIAWQWGRATVHLTELQRERTRAERNFRQAHETLVDIARLTRNGESEGVADDRPLREELAKLALVHYQKFFENEGDSPALLAEAIDAHSLVAAIYANSRGNCSKAIESYRAALRLVDDGCRGRPAAETARYLHKKAFIHGTIGQLLADSGKFAEAEEEFAIGQKTAADLLFADPESVVYRYEQVRGLIGLAQVRAKAERAEAALGDASRAQTLLASLAGRQHDTPRFLISLAYCYFELGGVWQLLGRLDHAAEAQRRCAKLQQAAARADPSLKSAIALARCEFLLGTIEWDRGRPAEALCAHRRGCKLLEAMLEEQPNALGCLRLLGSHVQCQARCLRETGECEQAIESFLRSADIWERLLRKLPETLSFQAARGAALHSIGNLYRDQQQLDRAVEFYQQALPIRRRLTAKYPSLVACRSDLSGTLFNFAEILERLGQFDRALEAFRESVKHETEVVKLQPCERKWRQRLEEREQAVVRLQDVVMNKANVTASSNSASRASSHSPSRPTEGPLPQ